MISIGDYVYKFYSGPEERFGDSFQAIKKIVERKVNSLLSMQPKDFTLLGWDAVVKELSITCPGKIEDMSFQQFPNLKLVIENKLTQFDSFQVTRRTHLVVSLLCPSHTYFHEMEFGFISKMGAIQVGSVIFLKDQLFDPDTKSIDAISDAVGRSFPKSTYVYHLNLFNAFFQVGRPWGAIDDEKCLFTAYDYLFESGFSPKVFP